jgi:hypothetical protein
VQLHRSQDAAFRRAVEEAVAAFAAGSRAGNAPPSGWGFLDGAELVVRGTGGPDLRDAAPANPAEPPDERKRRRVQIARARVKEWSPRVEDRFLSTLAATCNVKAACAEVGLTPASAYVRRQRWPAFAARWDAAVKTGYAQLEAGPVLAACNLFSTEETVDAGPIREMTAAQAIHLLHMHKNQLHGFVKRPGRRERIPDIEDVRASILRKIEAIERYDARRMESDQAEWARRRPSTSPG